MTTPPPGTVCPECLRPVKHLEKVEMYSLREASRRLGVDPSKLSAAIDAGDFPGLRFGDRYKVPVEAFESAVHNGWTPSQEPTVLRIEHVNQPVELRGERA